MPARRGKKESRSSPVRREAPTPAHVHRKHTPAPVVPGSLPEGVALAPSARDTPHGHLICHTCGRIAELDLSELDRHMLMELAGRRPKEWGLDGVTFSLTGTCPRCRREAR